MKIKPTKITQAQLQVIQDLRKRYQYTKEQYMSRFVAAKIPQNRVTTTLTFSEANRLIDSLIRLAEEN